MTNHTPEPWRRVEGHDTHTVDRRLGYVILNTDDYERAMDCTNACAGMDDPERDIERLKSRAFENDLTTIEACNSNYKLRTENEALRAALAFYAKTENWLEAETNIGMFPSDADKDSGHIARAALDFNDKGVSP